MEHSHLRIAIVAPDASAKFGGEAILPLHYFRHLRKRGIEAWMVLHSRTREELNTLLGNDIHRVSFVEDTLIDIWLHKFSTLLPARIAGATTGLLMRLYTQARQKKELRRLIKQHNISIIHEPAPVSPKYPSMMHGLGVPVVIGPMNGGMAFPPPFRHYQKAIERIFVSVARQCSALVNMLIPGKRKAAVLLVANERTKEALPLNTAKYKIITLVENGVDLDVFKFQRAKRTSDKKIRLIYVGRLVDWKALDLLLEALALVDHSRIELHILGDGNERSELEQLTKTLGLEPCVTFHGFLPQADCAEHLTNSDILILPSLYECGGAVVLEAMAMEKPVIATKWGGPADYLDETCGILVDPTQSKDDFVKGLISAITELASSTKLRTELGSHGRKKVMAQYSWEKKIDCVIDIYKATLDTLN